MLLAALFTGALLAAPGVYAAPGSEASRFHDDARSRLARNDAAGAIVQAQNALQKEPGLLAAQVLLGQALLKDGQAAAAEAQFEKALQKGARLERDERERAGPSPSCWTWRPPPPGW